jgi:peptidoglycan hydrolase-like protein with peptidoglycan-binding domain
MEIIKGGKYMATYTTLRNGSRGDEVKKLQQSLGIKADGIYGNQTAAAVKAYQKANGLAVDGIAGNQTLGKLYGGSTTTAPSTPTATAPAAPKNDTSFKYEDFKYDDYAKSDVVNQAEAMLKEQMANKPGEYQSSWQAQLYETINKILNREEFSYDLNGDALYQQYKDQYTTQGKMAMMDTMGQAAAMTGGYGNSYAQSVGQQAYQGYLQQLNDKVPELYQLALSQYNQEGQDLKDIASLLGAQEEKDYGRYRDNMSDYYTELQYLTDRADTLSQQEYNQWIDKLNLDYGIHSDKQQYAYQTHRDSIEDANTARKQAYDTAMSWLSLGVTPTAQMLAEAGISSADAQALAKKVLANEAVAASAKGSDGSNSVENPDDHKGGYDTHGYTTEQIKSLQRNAGIAADGIWGKQTQAAYDKGIRPTEEKKVGWFDYDDTAHKTQVKENGGSYYSQVLTDLQGMKKQGKSNKEAGDYLLELVGNSVLSRSEYLTLYNRYRDNKL